MITPYRLYQAFKYTVYGLLTLNIYLFFDEEHAAVAHRFADGMSAGNLFEAYAATIDTAAWVVLLLMFELETWVLDERQVTRRVAFALHTLRALCYGFITYTFYDGYLTKLLYLLEATPLGSVADLCTLVPDGWSYMVDLDEFVALSSSNCGQLSSSTDFMRFSGIDSVVDNSGYRDIIRLAWVDVINAGVWLLVVALLEFDVRMQEKGLLRGAALAASTATKYLLYPTLLAAAIYWGVKGDFVDFWDAFLWLVAFVFIELNVFEWRRETQDQRPESVAAESA